MKRSKKYKRGSVNSTTQVLIDILETLEEIRDTPIISGKSKGGGEVDE